MIRSHFEELRRAKGRREGRRITYAVIAQATGLSHGTLSRLNNGTFNAVEVGTMEALCRFFECRLGDLLEYVPGEQA